RRDGGRCRDRGWRQVAGAHRLHFDEGGAGAQHAELGGGGVGEVDEPVRYEGAAVVDLHDHALAVLQVGDPRVAGDRHHLVGGGHGVHVVGLAVRGAAAMELHAVPGCDAAVVIALAGGQQGVGLAQDRVAGRVAGLAGRHVGGHGVVDVGHVHRMVGTVIALVGRRHRYIGARRTPGLVVLLLLRELPAGG